MSLVRTQVQFTAEQRAWLREEASRRGMSASALLRSLVGERLDGGPEGEIDMEAAWAFVGVGRDSATDVARHHDDYLTGIRR